LIYHIFDHPGQTFTATKLHTNLYNLISSLPPATYKQMLPSTNLTSTGTTRKILQVFATAELQMMQKKPESSTNYWVWNQLPAEEQILFCFLLLL